MEERNNRNSSLRKRSSRRRRKASIAGNNDKASGLLNSKVAIVIVVVMVLIALVLGLSFCGKDNVNDETTDSGENYVETTGENEAVIDPSSYELQKDAIPEVNELVDTYPNAIMNVHPALIPSFCGKGFYGLHVHEAALAYGVKLSGATVHFVSEECDGGPIIAQKAVAIHEDDTPETLQKRIMEEAEWKLLPEAVSLFCQGRLSVEGRKVRIK